MVKNRIKPVSKTTHLQSMAVAHTSSIETSTRDPGDADSLLKLEETSYLKLQPFTKLDPTLIRLLNFLNCFGLTVNFVKKPSEDYSRTSNKIKNGCSSLCSFGNIQVSYMKYLKITTMVFICAISGEVVYDVNLRQSKLLAEQKRSTPLLTFVIVFYSWLSLIIPVICNLSLIVMGSHLFRFYSRTSATICNGKLRRMNLAALGKFKSLILPQYLN